MSSEQVNFTDRYPQIMNMITPIKNMIQQMDQEAKTNKQHFEFEARFGHINEKNEFEAGVSKEFYFASLERMQNTNIWHSVSQNKQTIDYYYFIQDETSSHLYPNQILIRTTVEYDMNISTHHIHKKSISRCAFKFCAPNNLADFPHAKYHDVRVSVNYEINTDELVKREIEIPTRVDECQCVRIKNRIRFQHIPSDMQIPIWSMDFTQSWSGKTRSEAEQKLQAGQPTYEIEIECLDPFAYRNNNPLRNDTFLVTSMALKLKNFIIPTDKLFYWTLQNKK